MKKNILIFGHSYETQFLDINNQYTKLFDKNNYEVTVAYLIGEPNDDIRKKHVADQVIFLNLSKKTARGLKLNVIKKMLDLTREKNFEITICHRYKPTYIMLWVSQIKAIPIIFSVMHELNAIHTWSRKMMLKLLAKDNVIFAGVSNAVRNNLTQSLWNIPSERVITLYNSIDVQTQEPTLLSKQIAREQLKLPQDSFVFGNIGRLAINKDQTTLIKAFAAIKNQCPNAKLIILGSGVLEDTLKKLTESLRIQKDVIFSGYVVDAAKLTKAFDVLVSSSIQEAFGMVLLEAMIAKVPIIATRVNGVPEVIDQSGILVDPSNVSHLSAEMLKTYQMNLATLEQLGHCGYDRAMNHFSLQKFKAIFWQLPIMQQKELV